MPPKWRYKQYECGSKALIVITAATHYQRDKKWKQCRRRAAIEPVSVTWNRITGWSEITWKALSVISQSAAVAAWNLKQWLLAIFGSFSHDENCRFRKFFDRKRSNCLILSLLTRFILKLLIQNSDWCSFSGSIMYKISSKRWMRWKKGLSNYLSSKTRPLVAEFFITSLPSLSKEFTHRYYLNRP